MPSALTAPRTFAEHPALTRAPRPEASAFRVTGPSRALSGELATTGCKNSGMPALVAAALSPARVTVRNVPWITDVHNLLMILEYLGCEPLREGSAVTFSPALPRRTEIPDALSRRLRGSVYALAVPVVHCREARIGQVGGDLLCGRSLEPHLRALRGFGLDVAQRSGGWMITAGPARPGEFAINDRGITATGLAVLIAASLDGESVIRDASLELETDDVLGFVRTLGARADRDGRTLVIRGPLCDHDTEIVIPPDQIMWGTFAIAAALTGGELTAPRAAADRGRVIVEMLQHAGVTVTETAAIVRSSGTPHSAFEVTTGEYPGFPSDLLPQAMVLASQCEGTSRFIERVYDHRFDHVDGLRALGIEVGIDGRAATVTGRCALNAARVTGAGIRESTSLLLAGLVAAGETEVHQASAIHRGYEDLPGDLRRLGATIETLSSQ
jgi:UDP-N-acetylglucosamine 1-carboxyvinyltransferase